MHLEVFGCELAESLCYRIRDIGSTLRVVENGHEGGGVLLEVRGCELAERP